MIRLHPVLKEHGIAIILFLIVFTVVFTSRYSRLHGSDSIVIPQSGELLLYEQADLNVLIDHLSESGVEIDDEEMYWASSILGWRNFRPGRYLLEGTYSYEDLLSKVARGNEDYIAVTVAPGIDIERLSGLLSRQLRADSADFASVFSDSSSFLQELNIDGQMLFSRMLPDTYNMYWTTRAEQVIRRIYSEFETRVNERLNDQIEESPLDLNEIITLASIVEWEAATADEKPVISGLYINRLNRNMYLQADPTVIFALGERRRLLYEDYRYDHPYNTYLSPGLPPGPITNPDMASIESVLNPETHDFLYMVASSDGGHVFTRTYDEHLEASAEWQRWIQEQYRIRDANEQMQTD